MQDFRLDMSESGKFTRNFARKYLAVIGKVSSKFRISDDELKNSFISYLSSGAIHGVYALKDDIYKKVVKIEKDILSSKAITFEQRNKFLDDQLKEDSQNATRQAFEIFYAELKDGNNIFKNPEAVIKATQATIDRSRKRGTKSIEAPKVAREEAGHTRERSSSVAEDEHREDPGTPGDFRERQKKLSQAQYRISRSFVQRYFLYNCIIEPLKKIDRNKLTDSFFSYLANGKTGGYYSLSGSLADKVEEIRNDIIADDIEKRKIKTPTQREQFVRDQQKSNRPNATRELFAIFEATLENTEATPEATFERKRNFLSEASRLQAVIQKRVSDGRKGETTKGKEKNTADAIETLEVAGDQADHALERSSPADRDERSEDRDAAQVSPTPETQEAVGSPERPVEIGVSPLSEGSNRAAGENAHDEDSALMSARYHRENFEQLERHRLLVAERLPSPHIGQEEALDQDDHLELLMTGYDHYGSRASTPDRDSREGSETYTGGSSRESPASFVSSTDSGRGSGGRNPITLLGKRGRETPPVFEDPAKRLRTEKLPDEFLKQLRENPPEEDEKAFAELLGDPYFGLADVPVQEDHVTYKMNIFGGHKNVVSTPDRDSRDGSETNSGRFSRESPASPEPYTDPRRGSGGRSPITLLGKRGRETAAVEDPAKRPRTEELLSPTPIIASRQPRSPSVVSRSLRDFIWDDSRDRSMTRFSSRD